MPLHDFIFSRNPPVRFRRYLVGILLWWAFIIGTVFCTPTLPSVFSQYQPGLHELGVTSYILLVLLKSFLLLCSHLWFCYTIIRIVMPVYIKHRNRLFLLLALPVITAASVLLSLGLYTLVYPLIDEAFDLPFPLQGQLLWRSIDAGTINAIKLTLIAIGFLYAKRWWTRQQENQQLEKEKISAELELLKAQIHPQFLFNTLQTITALASISSPLAPEMLIKLADLLSYMLYECDARVVALDREICMIEDYLQLEKLRAGSGLELTVQVNGRTGNVVISPLLLLPFIDNSLSFGKRSQTAHNWINIDISIEQLNLGIKLINGVPAGLKPEEVEEMLTLNDIQKRLSLLYPGKHDIKINVEHELLMVQLNLILEEAKAPPAVTNQSSLLKPAYAQL